MVPFALDLKHGAEQALVLMVAFKNSSYQIICSLPSYLFLMLVENSF
jgi:hypothetical protein